MGDIRPTPGPYDTAPKEAPTARVRSTLTMARDRESMTALWERSDDGTTWPPKPTPAASPNAARRAAPAKRRE
jgi:hypothetical protein